MSSSSDDTVLPPPRKPIIPSGFDGETVLPSNNTAGIHAPGDVIDNRYTVIREIGRGGMGVVYEVEDAVTSDRYAVKRLLPDVASNEQIVRAFVREGTAAERFSAASRYLVTTKTVGRDAAGFYVLMEMVTSPTLRQILKQLSSGGLQPIQAIPIFASIADALNDMHRSGLIHRDLKPENIFVIESDDSVSVQLVDFGLTRNVSAHTITGLSGAGSLRYMAPELFREEAATAAADVYAFGVIAYELLTGEPPIGMAQPISSVVPELDAAWVSLITLCLSPKISDRPTTIATSNIYAPQKTSVLRSVAGSLQVSSGSTSDNKDTGQLTSTLTLDVQEGCIVEINGRTMSAPFRYSMLADVGSQTTLDVQVTWQNFTVFHGQVALRAGQSQLLALDRVVCLTGVVPDWCEARTALGPLTLPHIGLSREICFVELLHSGRAFDRIEVTDQSGDIDVHLKHGLVTLTCDLPDVISAHYVDGIKIDFPTTLPVPDTGEVLDVVFRSHGLPDLSKHINLTPGRYTFTKSTIMSGIDVSKFGTWAKLASPLFQQYIYDLCPITAGRFQRIYKGNGDSSISYWVNVSAFRLGATPVTVGVWREYCSATGIRMPDTPIWGWLDDHPIVNVSWEDIMGTDGKGGFCAWASEVAGFSLTLPTEAQWEYGSRRGLDDFPWGNGFDDAKLWWSVNTKRTGTAPVVRSHNIYRNAYGLTDMAGNVWEWCSDWCADAYAVAVRTQWLEKTRSVRAPGIAGLFGNRTEEPYKHEVLDVVDVDNPVGPDTGKYRCVRGGSWYNGNPGLFRCANRSRNLPGGRGSNFGFRLSAGPG